MNAIALLIADDNVTASAPNVSNTSGNPCRHIFRVPSPMTVTGLYGYSSQPITVCNII